MLFKIPESEFPSEEAKRSHIGRKMKFCSFYLLPWVFFISLHCLHFSSFLFGLRSPWFYHSSCFSKCQHRPPIPNPMASLNMSSIIFTLHSCFKSLQLKISFFKSQEYRWGLFFISFLKIHCWFLLWAELCSSKFLTLQLNPPLRTGLYLETESWKRQLNSNEVVKTGPNATFLCPYKKRKLGHSHVWEYNHIKTQAECNHLQAGQPVLTRNHTSDTLISEW